MTPELISGIHYDSSADIWSFGITGLELAQGRAPRSRESSRTVLSQIVEAAAPTLDRQGGVHKYSRAFKEIVERCLAKDPSLRPTAAQLLQTPFFRNTKKPSYLVGAILRDLPPLAQRLERRKQATLLQHGTIDSWDFPTTLFHPSPTQTVCHRSQSTNIDGRKSIDEWDEIKEDEQTGGGALAEDGNGPKLGFDSLSSTPSTSAVSPTVASTPSLPSAPSEPVFAPPNRSLWHRIGIRKSSHGKEASESRSMFINSMLQRGKGGRGIMA